MPFTIMKPDVSNIPALFGLQRVQLKNLKPDTSLTNRFLKLTLCKDWGLKWVGTRPRRKIVLLESGPLDDQKINAYCIGQYAKDFSEVNVGDVVFVGNATVQKSATFSKDMIHPCQLVLSSESNPDVWVIPSKASTSSAAAQDSSSASGTTLGNAAVPAQAVPAQTTSSVGSAANQDQPSALFKDLYNYRYTPLKDVKTTRSIDVYGVVKFFKPPYKTSGADYCMMITLVDPSIDAEVSGLKCLIFNSDIDAMPKVLDTGDIVRFHRLKVVIFRDQLQGQKSPGFSCLVFAGSPEAPVEPRSTTTSYTLTELDKEKVKELRTWSKESGFIMERLKLTLSKVTESQHFDLICQVIATAASPEQDCFNLRVWDGTKCKLLTLDSDAYQLDETTQAEVDRIGHIAVDVFVNGQHVQFAKSVSPGDFVRFYNLYAGSDGNPQWGVVNGRSKVMFVLNDGTSYGRGMVNLSETNVEVRLLMRKLETAVEDALLAEAEDEVDLAETNNIEPSDQVSPAVGVDDAPDVMTLAKVTVGQYFDLTCQVIKTIEMKDVSCVCINVWDGTKMKIPCRKMDYSNYNVSMIPGLSDSAGSMAEDICLYDNHMVNGRKIKPGNFVKVTNLHAPGYPPLRKASLPPIGSSLTVELALHQGEGFGKNVEILSSDSSLVVPLKRRMDALAGKTPPVRAATSANKYNDADREKENAPSEELRCMQRFASFTANCERIKFVSITEAKDTPLRNKFRIRAKVGSYLPADVSDFVHVHCPACNHRCGLSFLKDFTFQGNHTQEAGTESTRRYSSRLRKSRPAKETSSEAGAPASLTEPRSSTRIRAQLQLTSQPTVKTKGSEVIHRDADQESDAPTKSTKRKQAGHSQESSPSGMTLRSSPKRARRDENFSDSQSSIDYETASQGSSQSSLPKFQRLHQRLKMVEVEGEHGTVEVKYVSANDVITLCKNGLKLCRPPEACLKYVPLSSPEPGINLLCPRCCPDRKNGSKILMNYEYLFKLNLTDDTGSIEVILQGDHATKFLNGLEPENLYKDNSQRNKLARIMEVIYPSSDPDPTADTSHPQLECCIKEHTVLRNGKAHRIYQLVDTLLSNDVTDV